MIHCKKENDIVVVSIENGKLNVLDTAFLKEIETCFKELADAPCKGVVITGTGRSFCAGVDLKSTFSNGKDHVVEFLDALSACFETLFEFPKPLIAAINGHALAGGCILSSLCDYKIVVDGKAKIGITELSVGVPFPAVPREIMLFILPRKSFQEVFYFAKGYSVFESKELGLVDEIVPGDRLLECALGKANELVKIPAQTFSQTKYQLRRPAILSYRSDDARSHDQNIKELWSTDEMKLVVDKFLEGLKG